MTGMVERVARVLCKQSTYDPDRLEPGDAFGIDGVCRNGDPGHFMWREYADRAQEIIEEMRAPYPRMTWSGATAFDESPHKGEDGRPGNAVFGEVWRAMIDASLLDDMGFTFKKMRAL